MRNGQDWRDCFPRAAGYARTEKGGGSGVAERGAAADAPPSERHVQCVWFDPRWRPAELKTETGEPVRVISPGDWNLEPGPDFLNAALEVGADRRRVAGAVEIHLHPRDWSAHGHADSPAYGRIAAHVTWFPARPGGPDLPPDTLRISLRDTMRAQPLFHFDNLDPTAYPYAVRGTPAPCAVALRAWPPADREELLACAGEERLRQKTARLAQRADAVGMEQAFYQEFLVGLGYRNNKAPARRLAEYLPLAELRAEAAEDDAETATALLLGVAGLLPAALPESSVATRRRWDIWWRRAARWEGRTLSHADWRLSSLRPLNHPARRLEAAARLFTAAESPLAKLEQLATEPKKFARRALRALDVRDPSGGPDAPALLGAARATALLLNLGLPALAIRGQAALFRGGGLERLPAEADSGLLRRMAHTLFGPDHPPSLYRDGLRRQGLLQIFHDYCLTDRSRCAACPFPDWLRRPAAEIPHPAGGEADGKLHGE